MVEKRRTPSILKSTGKPIIKNPDGSISTEETITVQVQDLNKNRYTNIPTIINGKRVSEKTAIQHATQNQKNNMYPHFNSLDEAVKSAKSRSAQLGKDYANQKKEKRK